jgi:hypothetical protein
MNQHQRTRVPTSVPPRRESRDRAAHLRKLTLLKRLSLAAAVLAFGGGWTLVGQHAVGVTSQPANAASATGITPAVPTADPSTVPGLGHPNAQGFFAYQPGLRASAAASSAGTTARMRPSIRSRAS